MKPGKATVAAYYVACPHCDAALMDPGTGSYMIGPDSVDAFKGRTVTCFDCGRLFNLPAPVAKLGRAS